MSCVKHFMGLRWERHHWIRRVTHTETKTSPLTDKWGRVVATDDVTCHAHYVCRECGAVREGEECLCDKVRADECAVRLACLEGKREADPVAHV